MLAWVSTVSGNERDFLFGLKDYTIQLYTMGGLGILEFIESSAPLQWPFPCHRCSGCISVGYEVSLLPESR